jgi:membrane-associated protein
MEMEPDGLPDAVPAHDYILLLHVHASLSAKDAGSDGRVHHFFKKSLRWKGILYRFPQPKYPEMDPSSLIDLILHFDVYLPGIIAVYGFWTYLILFIIIFCETGFVVFPYLPGDSLLFVAGTLAGAGFLNVEILIVTLVAAAVIGDSANYWIGKNVGMKALEKNTFVKKGQLEKTEEYFTRYGGLTIVIARFVPFIRTFAPFLAGVGKMNYRWFLGYNILGAVLWVLGFVLAGYFLGSLPIVQDNFSLIIYAIIGVSLLAVGSVILGMFRKAQPTQGEEQTEAEKKE